MVKLGSEDQPLAQHSLISYITKNLHTVVAASTFLQVLGTTQSRPELHRQYNRPAPPVMCGPLFSCGRIVKEKWPSAAAAPAGNMWEGSKGTEQKVPTNKGKAPERPQNLEAINDALMPQVTNHYSRGRVEKWLES